MTVVCPSLCPAHAEADGELQEKRVLAALVSSVSRLELGAALGLPLTPHGVETQALPGPELAGEASVHPEEPHRGHDTKRQLPGGISLHGLGQPVPASSPQGRPDTLRC